MESKRKKRPVRRAVQTPTVKPPKIEPKANSVEALIKQNGDLIESLISHQGWSIVEDLIDEGVASVSGRKTNGYYHNGDLTRGGKNKEYLTGYQEALTQLYNRVKDFITFRDNMINKQRQEESEKNAPVYNTFLESDNETED